ncbi:MAG: polysaccharide deacetylase [Proteobacteria bacterium]|nr:polysaccharide deacetylase [Pseudomonadota bacterium]
MAKKDVHVALTFDYDAYSLWIGTFDAKSPSMISRGEFGAQGVRRILSLLDNHKIKATFFTPGHTALAFPKTVEDIVAGGHEIGHHGWIHENPATTTPDQERWILERGFEALDQVVGIRPVGYRSPAWDNSPNTIPLLLEFGFAYESSLMGSEYEPYWCRVGDKWSKTEPWKFGKPVDLVEVPVSWLLDDFPHFEYVVAPGYVNPGFKNPRDVLKMWTDEFDYLYDRIGSGVFNLTMHPQVIGRGGRMLLLEAFIEHVSGRDGVTFGTLESYVRKWRVGKSPSLPVDAGA